MATLAFLGTARSGACNAYYERENEHLCSNLPLGVFVYDASMLERWGLDECMDAGLSEEVHHGDICISLYNSAVQMEKQSCTELYCVCV